MPWVILLLSALLEAVWATALGMSEGFSNPIPTVVFLISTTLSMVGLAYALKSIPLGTAYSVWTGLGAAMTAAYSMLTGAEAASVWKIIFLIVIVSSAVGLKVVSADSAGGRVSGSGSSHRWRRIGTTGRG